MLRLVSADDSDAKGQAEELGLGCVVSLPVAVHLRRLHVLSVL